MKKLSIIIPAYNEEHTIAEIVKRVQAVDICGLEQEIIVVDNNSRDRTFVIASALPNVRTVKETRPGKGAAVKRGFKEATGDILTIQDADLEYDPGDLPAVVRPVLEGRSIAVLGVRIEDRHQEWRIRVLGGLGNFAITTLTNILYWNDAGEYEGCYKAFTKTLVDSITVRTDNFDYDNELVCKILKRGIKTMDVPIHYYPRDYTEGKKINWRHGFLILWTIFKYRFVD